MSLKIYFHVSRPLMPNIEIVFVTYNQETSSIHIQGEREKEGKRERCVKVRSYAVGAGVWEATSF
jgi:hypothetical protein